MRRFLFAAAVLLTATTAQAERVCWLSFDALSSGVATMELETCPGIQMRSDQGFCRLGLAGHELLLYVFRRVGPEACLAQVTRYTVDEFMGRFGTSYIRP